MVLAGIGASPYLLLPTSYFPFATSYFLPRYVLPPTSYFLRTAMVMAGRGTSHSSVRQRSQNSSRVSLPAKHACPSYEASEHEGHAGLVGMRVA